MALTRPSRYVGFFGGYLLQWFWGYKILLGLLKVLGIATHSPSPSSSINPDPSANANSHRGRPCQKVMGIVKGKKKRGGE